MNSDNLEPLLHLMEDGVFFMIDGLIGKKNKIERETYSSLRTQMFPRGQLAITSTSEVFESGTGSHLVVTFLSSATMN